MNAIAENATVEVKARILPDGRAAEITGPRELTEYYIVEYMFRELAARLLAAEYGWKE